MRVPIAQLIKCFYFFFILCLKDLLEDSSSRAVLKRQFSIAKDMRSLHQLLVSNWTQNLIILNAYLVQNRPTQITYSKTCNKETVCCKTEYGVAIAKFVVSRCEFCKLRRNLGFFCSVNDLSGPLRKHMFTCDWCILIHFVCFFVSRFAACDHPVSQCFRR